MKIMSVMPAAAASSTAYWISGLSTIGNISFGLALVTGRKRLPSPATGNTAFVILFMGVGSSGLLVVSREQVAQPLFVKHGDAKFPRLFELAAGVVACDHVI